MQEVKKAIVLVGGMGSRFLPLSKVLPKEFWPLGDLPVIHYILKEIAQAGIKEVIFVVSPENKLVLDYIKPSPKIEKILQEKEKKEILRELKDIEDIFKNISFSYVVQRKPLGDGHAVLQAAKLIGDEAVASFYVDDIVESKIPAISQLIKVFKTCQKPVIGLYRLSKEKLPSYGVFDVEKIANRVYKIKKIIEKPKPGSEPSQLCHVGRHILTPEVFDYLRKAKPTFKGEIIYTEVFNQMLRDGKLIYGYEFEGEWLECGNKLAWMKTHLHFCLKHPEFGPEIKNYLKQII